MKSRKVKAYNARKKPKVDLAIEVSDDSDVNSDSFYHDEIDDFHNKQDNELSTDDELIHHKDDSSDEEEVLPITDDDDEDESNDDEHGLPNREAWGKKSSTYYSADFVDQDRGRTYREEDAAAAEAEGEEASVIQKSVFDIIQASSEKGIWAAVNLEEESKAEEEEEKEKIGKGPSTKQEILTYLKKETKIFEYKSLIESTIQKLKKLLRLKQLIEKKKIQSKEVERYVRKKIQILRLINNNIIMYFKLLSTGKCLKYHPIIQRIDEVKQLLDDLESEDHLLSSAIDELLEKESRGEEINICSEPEDNLDKSVSKSVPEGSIQITNGTKKMKKSKIKHVETENEKEVISYANQVKEEMRKRKLEEMSKEDDECVRNDEPAVDQDDEKGENNADEKRIISYQIAKNKGLVPRRKKEYRNPRVRHREKYRKAQIRRKGQVRGVIKEIKRYEGEPTGINMNVVRSIKFK